MGLWGTPANALSLGRVIVQSALGQPLKAEIDILDINAEEAATLSARIAAPEAFKSAGLEYNPAMSGLQASLQRRANGRAFLKLSSDRVINEPFVDMILEASWSTGRIVRDYTMLFDPPGLNATVVTNITPAQAPAPARTPAPIVSAAPEVKPMPAPAPVVKPTQTAKLPVPSKSTETQQVVVKAGETAGRLAAANKPANVSLDQMLVAMLRTNPDAFIGDNVNRIKAGVIVMLPTEAQASATAPAEARQIIVAQSNDFNEFRRKLAGLAPVTQVTPSSRDVSGKLQASVEDKKPGATTPDKLTLSKGVVTGKSTEDQLAQAKNAKAAADRAAELAKNLQDLSKIAAASSDAAALNAAVASSATPATPAPPPPALAASPAAPVSAPAITVAAAPASASVAAPAPATPISKATPPASMPPLAEPGLMATLLEDPLVPAGALGLIALLAGLGFYKSRQRRNAESQDSTFGDSRVQAESFFGSSGGQHIDTNEGPATGSSMIYSPSQLDAVDEVDPVAEADVYLAYGRDLQAEEILKDALRTRPERLAIHHKLLEIYAKRRDSKAFEAIATQAFNLTNGVGQEWEQICEMGLALDPDNALYLPGGQPLGESNAPSRPAPLDAGMSGMGAGLTNAAPDLDFSTPGSSELDLDLDFSLDEPDLPDAPAVPKEPIVPNLPTLPTLPEEPESEAVEMDFGELTLPPLESADEEWSAPQPTERASLSPEATAPMTLEMELELEDDDPFGKTQVLSAAPKQEKPVDDSGMMEFDLGSLSLDFALTKPGELSNPADAVNPLRLEALDEPETQAGAFMDAADDPLETKLALADEFKAIGDDDGARALIEEVIAESTGEMKARAQRALKQL